MIYEKYLHIFQWGDFTVSNFMVRWKNYDVDDEVKDNDS